MRSHRDQLYLIFVILPYISWKTAHTLISCFNISGLFWTMRLIFLSATYWTSGSELKSVTRGGASFRRSPFLYSTSGIPSMKRIKTLIVERTTAALAWDKRGVTRSQIDLNMNYIKKSMYCSQKRGILFGFWNYKITKPNYDFSILN